MEYRTLGSDGLGVSVIGLGGVELGSGDTTRGEPSAKEAAKAVAVGLDAGMNWLDTAEAYHDTGNEAFIGEVLGLVRRERVLLSTKLLPKPNGTGFRAEEVRQGCRASLARLRCDCLDIYLLHAPDETGVPLEETWGAMSGLAEEGLVRAIGLSNFALEDIERCNAWRKVDLVQDGLSLVDHLDNRELFLRLDDLGIGVVVYEPIGSGALSGRPIEEIREVWADWSEAPVFKRLLEGENGEKSASLVAALRPVAERHRVSVPQLAVAWVLHQGGVTAALAGSSNPEHVRANAAAADLELDEDALAELEALISLGPTRS